MNCPVFLNGWTGRNNDSVTQLFGRFDVRFDFKNIGLCTIIYCSYFILKSLTTAIIIDLQDFQFIYASNKIRGRLVCNLYTDN